MHAALGTLVSRWMAAHPFAERLPEWLTPPHRRLDPLPADPAARQTVVMARADIDAHVNTARDGTKTSFRQRRAVGELLADYLERHGLLSQEHALKLRACRHGGAWGIEAEGGRLVVAWDSKCSLTLLCPHCARTEQRRLVKRYKEPMKRWKQQRAPRRIHSGVFTWPNVTPGELAGKLRLIFKWFRSVSRAFPSIKGYVATVEAPLSARGDWNLHLNVLLCVEGPLHWGDLRAAWHRKTAHLFPGYEGTSFQVALRQLPRYDDDALDKVLRELIKYPVKHVTEKSNGRSESVSGGGAKNPVGQDAAAERLDVGRTDNRSAKDAAVCYAEQSESGSSGSPETAEDGDRSMGSFAPAVTDWPPDRFNEWWQGHRRYRRTRSYGCLFGEDLDDLAGDTEDRPRGEVTWYGRIWWDALARAYAVSAAAPVGLIQANNSHPGTGPPGPKSAQGLSTGPPRLEAKYRNRQLAPGG